MPHLSIQFSDNLEADMQALCDKMKKVLVDSGLFPLGGIRVRAVPCTQYVVADALPENGFADLILRIGAGRSSEEKQATGKALMAEAEKHFTSQLQIPHFALSLEIIEISSEFSWKTNSIHSRLSTPKPKA
jgi:5-carboxymethyl-2-hydroxymuconate isomerase